jgi:4'-phosphopantetheinyl transferase EntD
VTRDGNGDADPLDLWDRLEMLARAAHPELCAGCRKIAVGDELALTPAELHPMERAVVSVRRASGAARIVARTLLADLGASPGVELPRSASRAPIWPSGFVGSLAHDPEYAAAAVARSAALRGVGIDIEPALPLSEELLDMIATPSERRQINGDLVLARLLFCIKEAVYKATHPIDGLFLEQHDVEISFELSVALTSSGYNVRTG